MSLDDRYYSRFAAAFVRGKAIQDCGAVRLSRPLAETPLDELSAADIEHICVAGRLAGLKLHKFKRSAGLPRVRRVLGILHAVAPTRVLDVGSGRGVFLWPLLDTFPQLAVTAIDQNPRRATDLQAVALGGVDRLVALRESVAELPFDDRSQEIVSMLEVLEHVGDPQRALAEVVRVAERFVVLTVPSKKDHNPEHIHLFDELRLRDMFSACGIARLSFDFVPGHILVVANVAGGS